MSEKPTVVRALHSDHVNLAKLLDAIERQMATREDGRQPDYELVHEAIDYCLNYPEVYHHRLEDAVFARLQAREPWVAKGLIDLEAEHRDLAALTRRFGEAVQRVLLEEEVARDALDHLARDFLDSYRQHIGVEESMFLPAAARALSP
ncbi:MAG: hemerythrin domain-containing protein, partial [Kiloniellaceae bacterium]